jgi:tetratricopeptide (TPR) repeat protein
LQTKTYLLQNKVPEASLLLSSAPVTINNAPFFLVSKGGVCLSNAGNNDSCRSYFERAINMTKGKDAAILAAVAEMEVISQKGNMSSALELVQRAMKRTKNDAWLHVLMGNIYRKMRNGGNAFNAYMTAIKKDKNLAEAYYLLGEIFVSQQNPEMYLGYFNQSIEADPKYAPAWYELYRHYLYTEPDAKKAMQYFENYAALSDKTIRYEYAMADLLYLNKDYEGAIKKGKNLLQVRGNDVQPRIYKLIAYSYAESHDTVNAFNFMQQYFQHGKDSDFIAMDFESMAQIIQSLDYSEDSVIKYYRRALSISKDSAKLAGYYKELAGNAAAKKDFTAQAKWLQLYYDMSKEVNNVDLFNWGIAAYRSNNYTLADSVFGLYTEKYPDQGFGFYWRARTNAIIDTGMRAGLAVPYYNRLIEILDTASLSDTNKKWMLEACGYVAAYEANTRKNYDEAVRYFDKILEIDPDNADAKKYIAILEKTIKRNEEPNSSGDGL